MMRYRIRLLFIILFIHIVIATFIWSLLKNPDLLDQPRLLALTGRNPGRFSILTNITCNINGEYNVTCLDYNDEIYIPFKFIKKYFDVYGKVVEQNGIKSFNWSHSYATVYIPKKKYDPRGVFTHFQSYKVEERERVKCISASEGVPISTQWDPQGYFYPTQIAQFALSHYSKRIIEPSPIKYILENGQTKRIDWIGSTESSVKRIVDDQRDSIVTCFNTKSSISANISSKLSILSFDLKLEESAELIVVVRNIVEKQMYSIHYTCSQDHLQVFSQDIYYGIFCEERNWKWHKLSRDIYIDVIKGIMSKTPIKPKPPRSIFQLESVSVVGKLCIDNLTISSGDHLTQFQFAVEWFLHHQDPLKGGWQVPVTRKMAGSLILKPGWVSAMGQGHALSVLARAYHLTKDVKYLQAGKNALRPFKVLSKDGGILAMFLNEVPWYEEYPTNPSTFVLNGFIFSLIGLYDFYMLAPSEYSQEARVLYLQGLSALKKLLLIFDTGLGTTYDLRHVTMGVAPKLARWDYHATHINQLFMLSTIEKDQLFVSTAKRWMGYMSGKRASHN